MILLFIMLRLVANTVIGIPEFIFWFLKSRKNINRYKENRKIWNSINTYDGLIAYFLNIYRYKYDLGRGLLDHDSSIFEWCLSGETCDDSAVYSKKKLKQLGLKPIKVGIYWWKKGPNIHFDTYYIKDNKYCLFNYGKIIESYTEDDMWYKFKKKWNIQNESHVKLNLKGINRNAI